METILGVAGRTKMIKRAEVAVEPNDTPINRVWLKDTKIGPPGLSTTWLQASKMKIHNVGEIRRPKFIPFIGAGDECREGHKLAPKSGKVNATHRKIRGTDGESERLRWGPGLLCE